MGVRCVTCPARAPRRPSIILSYLFNGLAALLAATCFAELVSEYPVSGGAFSYVLVSAARLLREDGLEGMRGSRSSCLAGACPNCCLVTAPLTLISSCLTRQINFGELAAFVTLGGLLLEYALGMAAVARGFSRYFARLCNLDQTAFVLEVWDCAPGQEPPDCPVRHSIDLMAGGIVVVMSVLLSLGVRESAVVISGARLHLICCCPGYSVWPGWQRATTLHFAAHAGVTVIKIALLVFVAIVGYTRAGPTCEADALCMGMSCATYCENQGVSSATSPWFDPDFGANGVFLGAAACFFAFTGMDAICNAAEEVGCEERGGGVV